MSFDNSIYYCHRRETHALKPIFIKSLGKWQQISINWRLFEITIYHTLMFKHWPMSDGVSNKLNGNSYSSFTTERSSFQYI